MEATRPIWIRGPQLRARWAGMANSTFYAKLKRGLIPAPHYPFGPGTPYWRLDEIEAAEARDSGKEVVKPRPAPSSSKRGRHAAQASKGPA